MRSDQQIGHYEPPNKQSGFTSCGKYTKKKLGAALCVRLIFEDVQVLCQTDTLLPTDQIELCSQRVIQLAGM